MSTAITALETVVNVTAMNAVTMDIIVGIAPDLALTVIVGFTARLAGDHLVTHVWSLGQTRCGVAQDSAKSGI